MGGKQGEQPRGSEASASGKLYVAGEYAVVEHGHPAILVAVNRLLTTRITACDESRRAHGVEAVGRIHSAGHPEASVTWRRRAGRVVPDLEQPGAAFILAVIHAVEELAQEAGKRLVTYDVNIDSQLDDKSGRKYGLGSSAAVTVATMKALTKFYGLKLTPMQQYKLAFVAASRAQKVGSGGDIAASLFGGCIRFTAVDRRWVTNRLQDRPLVELIDMPWPGLSVSRIRAFGASSTLRLMVGWTGDPASTPTLVGHVQSQSAAEHERMYQDFLGQSDVCVDMLARALGEDDEQEAAAQIRQARKLLQGLSSFTGVTIETPELRELTKVAESHGAAAKSSGAGGGDCGIAIAGPDADAKAIEDGWTERGIVPLHLDVCAPQVSIPEWRAGGRHASDGSVSERKDDHVRLALDEHADERRNAFDDLAFMHHSLASVAVNDVDMSTEVCGKAWAAPFFINAMTGGSSRTGEINASLARVAGRTGLAIASGSQHAAIREPALEPTFTAIREHDAEGFVFANVGPTVTPEQAVRAVGMVRADALQVHVNAAQELVMPEGNRDFDGWPERIAAIVKASPVPVVVKEVGFGMSARTIRQLAGLGVRTVDVSGRGGTDFAHIENARRQRGDYAYLDGWGQSTTLCLLAWQQVADASDSSTRSAGFAGSASAADSGKGSDGSDGSNGNIAVMASGGVRNPLDVVKALALGARAVGVSGHFLQVLSSHGEDGLAAEIEAWKDQVRSLMALLGAKTVADLGATDLLVTGKSAEEARLLGVDLQALARRSQAR
ncbi:phosphomevalonate kinase [Bifidobacterium sp. ESL0763]|uniref:phosphomevalonate kinase n=1 Tax=Bifidobacterium sp. ESL0763 TaxID=2983227 RepID=UPI0023F91880|nr:phosphomevalonate kinase [Bifidobacterium sp. ESL0763]MDF7663249.1 phosphomevalonate kinase [Bifidobacterium sp. ESL0763]